MCAHAYAHINRRWQQAADLQHAADVVHLVRRELVFPSGFRPLHMRCNIFLQAPGPAVECAHACIDGDDDDDDDDGDDGGDDDDHHHHDDHDHDQDHDDDDNEDDDDE